MTDIVNKIKRKFYQVLETANKLRILYHVSVTLRLAKRDVKLKAKIKDVIG